MTGTAGGEFVRALGHGKLPLLSRSRTTGSTRSARSTITTVKRPISRLLAGEFDLDALRVVDAPKVALDRSTPSGRRNLDTLHHEPNNAPAPL